jgi:hypothetical protein
MRVGPSRSCRLLTSFERQLYAQRGRNLLSMKGIAPSLVHNYCRPEQITVALLLPDRAWQKRPVPADFRGPAEGGILVRLSRAQGQQGQAAER